MWDPVFYYGVHMKHTNRKIPMNVDVLTAAKKRITDVFDIFERLCVSFSGGKDSTVMLSLTANEARRRGVKFCVLFIDWEVQYSATIQHVNAMRESYADCIKVFYWVCLPLTTVNGVSAIQPEWTAWAPDQLWVRQPPEDAITTSDFFPFYQQGMTFERFVAAFNVWFADGEPAGIMIGIRSDESLNRFHAISSKRKNRLAPDKPWTTRLTDGESYAIYPIYDWQSRDIWRYHANTGLPYNTVYDLMYRAGVTLSAMRICEPFGPEQRKGLWLYHILEPDTWSRACERVSGASSGAKYVDHGKEYFGQRKINKPINHSWESYAFFLLASLPHPTAEHYRNKIAIYIQWYKKREWPQGIPDEQKGDMGSKDIPSWRRICKVILRNDYWCRGLSFSPTQSGNYKRYMERLKYKRKMWGGI